MMQLQLKILQERQKNVALKKLVAQNIIAQSGTHSQQQYFQSPQPMPQLPQHNMLSKHHLEHIRHGVHANNDNMMLQNGDFASVQHKTSAPGNSNSHTNPSHISSSVHSDEGYILNELSKLQSGNQDELAKEDKPRVRFLQAQPNNQKLHSLQEQITSIVQETTKLLSNDVDDQLPFNKRKQKQQRAAHIKHKQDVQSLLRNKNTTSLEILPKWKHMQLKNNSNPPPYTVMKSVRLWRIVAWSLVVMVTTPIVDVYKK
ncbi:hypothetical protein EON65_14355 [archaeon]|nr:MAG: hypothetical protein EON65_14355 [archaeon]